MLEMRRLKRDVRNVALEIWCPKRNARNVALEKRSSLILNVIVYTISILFGTIWLGTRIEMMA